MPKQKISRNVLKAPRAGRTAEAASFLLQLDDLSRRLFEDLEGCGAPELGWQVRRGANTIGMLLAHNAIVEVYWMLIATESFTPERLRKILGLDMDDDGMPLPAGSAPPANLRGRTLAWYRRLHDKARAFSTAAVRTLDSAAMNRVIRRPRRDGSRHDCNVRWILYHVLEHQAGHYGQMLLLRHLHLDRRKK